MRRRLSTGSIGLLLALAALPASAGNGGLTGDEVQVDMLTMFAGGFEDPTAVVGPGVEFSTTYNGLQTISVDVGDSSFTLAYVNTGPLAFNLGLLGFELSSLDFGGGGVIADLQEIGSTWPANAFSQVTFGPHSISIELADPNFQIPAGASYAATFAIVVPEPAGSAALAAAGIALGALRRVSRRPSPARAPAPGAR